MEKKISPAKVVVLGEGNFHYSNFCSPSRKDFTDPPLCERVLQ